MAILKNIQVSLQAENENFFFIALRPPLRTTDLLDRFIYLSFLRDLLQVLY